MTGGKLVTGNMIRDPEQNGSGGKIGIEGFVYVHILYVFEDRIIN